MPLLFNSAYRPTLALRNGHLQTIYPVLLRRVELPPFRRERITTPDGDFLDLDWLQHPPAPDRAQPPLAILTHGLEGNTSQGYIRGMARALYHNGWDVLAWNMRGCSGEPNRRLRSYHSGATDDLHCVILHAGAPCPATGSDRHSYRQMALIGFSLGGNIVLKYVGDQGAALCQPLAKTATRIRHAVGISVPCDLAGSTAVLERISRRIYMERFLRTLRAKIRIKKMQFPDAIDDTGLDAIRTFRQFDDRYTAPLHGFKDAKTYWHQCSCLRSLANVAIPTLLLNAADDPFLSANCYPAEIARKHSQLHLEVTRHGGHVGFIRTGKNATYYSEARTLAFLAEGA